MINEVATFFTMKSECKNCRSQVWWIRRTCQQCEQEYPTSRPTLYWVGVVFVIAIPTIPIAIAGQLGWI